jgi:hypothetical protein
MERIKFLVLCWRAWIVWWILLCWRDSEVGGYCEGAVFHGCNRDSIIITLGNLQWKSSIYFVSGFHCLPFHFIVTDTEGWQSKHPVGAIRNPFSIQPVITCCHHNRGKLDISRNHCEINWAKKAPISFACFSLPYNDTGRSRLPVVQQTSPISFVLLNSIV